MSSGTPWANYWNSQNIWTDSALWRRQMQVFVRLSDQVLGYSKDDNVLDFGCGSGHFAELATDVVGTIVCADMSEHYVSLCQKKFATAKNVTVVRVAPDMSDLAVVGEGFTKVLCFSVLHYFAELDHVAAFVRGMQRCCVPGAKLLIADIGSEQRTWKNRFDALTFSLREGMLLPVVSMIYKTWFGDSQYRNVKSEQRYLDIPDGYFDTLGQRLGVRATYLDTQFTINTNYQNVLIEF